MNITNKPCRYFFGLLITLLMVSSLSFAQESNPNAEREIIVMFKPNIIHLPAGRTEATLNEITFQVAEIRNALTRNNVEMAFKTFPNFKLADTLGVARTGERVRLANLSNIFKFRLARKENIDKVISELVSFPDVIYAEPNGYAIHQVVYPNDEWFDDPNNPGTGGLQWNLLNTGQSGGSNDADIDAPEAWDITKGTSNTMIGIIDGGVEDWHEDLGGKVSGDVGWGWDGHGFHVAGIAAANTNNGDGMAGIDWNAQINSQRIDNADDAGIYDAVMDAVNAGSEILNNSWTLCSNCLDPVPTPRYSTTVRLAFANAYKQNVIAAAAMGNFNTSDTYYPAGFDQGIIAVGASNRTDGRWEWNSTSGSNTGAHIDVVAPGEDIISAVPYTTQYGPYDIWTGTSMAVPHVSGIAGLLLAKNSDLYNDDIEQIVRLAVDDKGPTGWDPEYGTGRVNAKKALDYLQSPYTLNHWTATNGTIYSTTGTFWMTFYSTPGLADGSYIVKRYVVRKSVTFPSSFSSAPEVWGRGVATTGYNYANPNFGMGWCKVVDGTVTNTGATLETVVYEVWTIGGSYKGWYPTSPSNVTFAYTVLGLVEPLSVYISGPSTLGWKERGTWTANPSGGSGSYTYEWRYRYNGSGSWSEVVGTQQQYSRTMLDTDFELQVKVTSGSENAYDTHYVYYGLPKVGVDDNATAQIPERFALKQNYPNPFNPTTEIKFDLPKAGHVTLRISNIVGQQVRTLVDEQLPAGYYNALWDSKDAFGNEVASGIYVYRISVRPDNADSKPFESLKKMTLLR